ncbi:hypothetical protein EV426DRAFT_702040 [Tirmania nivea]|nr:hypothetical protein EV426DRAFT_702040 [Tirmania nivea]
MARERIPGLSPKRKEVYLTPQKETWREWVRKPVWEEKDEENGIAHESGDEEAESEQRQKPGGRIRDPNQGSESTGASGTDTPIHLHLSGPVLQLAAFHRQGRLTGMTTPRRMVTTSPSTAHTTANTHHRQQRQELELDTPIWKKEEGDEDSKGGCCANQTKRKKSGKRWRRISPTSTASLLDAKEDNGRAY